MTITVRFHQAKKKKIQIWTNPQKKVKILPDLKMTQMRKNPNVLKTSADAFPVKKTGSCVKVPARVKEELHFSLASKKNPPNFKMIFLVAVRK